MSGGHRCQRDLDGKGATVRWGPEEAGRETCGPDEQKRRSRPSSRGEVARYTEPGVRATQVNGAGSMEGPRSYPGRPPGTSVVEEIRSPGRRSATGFESSEESAEVVVLGFEASGRGSPAVMALEVFGPRKDRTVKSGETSARPRGWR